MLAVNGGRSRGRRGAHAMSDSRLRGKWCPVCKTHKPPEEFHRDPSNSDMMHSCCRICKRERKRANRQMLKDARQLLDLQSNGPGGAANAPVLRSRLQLRLQSAEQDAAANGLVPYNNLQHSGGGDGAPVDYSQQLAALPPALGSQQGWGSHQQALDSLHLSSSAQAQPLHGRDWGQSLLADGVGARGRRRSQGLTHADSETRARLIESFRQAAQQPPFQQLAAGFPVRQVQIKEELSLAPPRLNGAAAHHHPGTMGLSAAAELRQYHQQQMEHGGGGQNGVSPPTNGLRQGEVSPHLMQLALQQMLSQLRPEQVMVKSSSTHGHSCDDELQALCTYNGPLM